MIISTKRLISALVLGLALAASNPARAEVTLEMAYMPIVPCSQLFVIEGMGWAKEAGINLELTRFSNGPARASSSRSSRPVSPTR